MIGQTISHYRIIEKIGEGGMGVVYKAQDTNLDRFVALKFLPERLSGSEQDRARFLQEAKAASALNHPNICTIYGIEEQDGKMFIVMELVEGHMLSEKKSSLSFKQAIDIGIQLAEGLAVAHEKGIVHRDIKPENIMIRKDGIAQIMDFGLAKLRGVSRLTKEGSTVGTAGYMSPEQVQGQDADHRSDIFSLGVLLYELFTGQLPFRGVHETALMYEIVNVDPPPMSALKSEIDAELDRIVLECMEKDPNERTQSVKQVAVDLNRFKRTSSREHMSRVTSAHRVQSSQTMLTTDPTAKNAGWQRFMVPALMVIVVFACAFMLWKFFFGSDNGSKEIIKFEVSLPPGTELGQYLDISPDGKQVAYVGSDRNGPQIYIRTLSELESHPISGTQGASFVFFSPRGDWIGFEANGSLKKISVRGGSAITLCVIDNLRGADWGDDNFILYSPGSSSGLWRVSADGGTPQPVTQPDSSVGEISHRYPELLPGSKAVLFTIKTNSISKFSEAKIAVQKLDAKEKRVLIEGGSFAKYLPTGHLLYGQGGSIYIVAFDPDRLELRGSPVRVPDGGMFVEGFGSMTMAVSSNGTLVYSPGGPLPQDSNTVVLFDRKGNAQPLVDAPAMYASVAISPDRERLVSYMQAANDDIWLYDIRRQLRTRFTFAGGNNWWPMWSLDGKHVLYTAERGGPPNLFWKPADGSGSEERLARGPYIQVATSWSPDGKLLAFHQSNASGNSDIWILPMTGERTPIPFLQTKFDEEFAAFSPDGRWMAYSTNESGISEIFAVPYPKGDAKVQVSIGGGLFPSWVKGKAGEEIIYFNFAEKKMMRVPITFGPDIRPGRAEALFSLRGRLLWRPDVSPDGERIAMAFAGQQATLTKLIFVVNWFDELKKLLATK